MDLAIKGKPDLGREDGVEEFKEEKQEPQQTKSEKASCAEREGLGSEKPGETLVAMVWS